MCALGWIQWPLLIPKILFSEIAFHMAALSVRSQITTHPHCTLYTGGQTTYQALVKISWNSELKEKHFVRVSSVETGMWFGAVCVWWWQARGGELKHPMCPGLPRTACGRDVKTILSVG